MHILLGILVVAAAIPLVGLCLQLLAARVDRRCYPPPGDLVPTGSHTLHLRRGGAGHPTVVLEAGIAASSVSWHFVFNEVERFTSVVVYDRAGYGWSGKAREELTADQLISDLHRVVGLARNGPVVLVGHSFGGLLVRMYAQRYPAEVAGMVLVDPALTSEWSNPTEIRRAMLARGVRFSRRGALLARFGVVRLGLALASAGAKSLAKFVARASSSGGGQRTVERLIGEVRKLPPELLGVVRSHWSRPEAFHSMAQHLAILPQVCATLQSDASGPGGIPVTVISGGHLTPEQLEEQASVARLFREGKHVIAECSAHWVHLDEPDLVAREIRLVVQRVHNGEVYG